MKDRMKDAFNDIRADEALLAKTAAYLEAERAKRGEKRGFMRPLRLVGALAAMLVLVVSILGYRTFYSDAAAYVSLDVNPSMELTLNRMDKVIATTAYNGDGEAVLRQVDITGKPYDQAVGILLAEMERQGYISGDALVTLTVQAADDTKEQRLCNTLLQTADKQVNIGQSAAEVEVFPVTQEVRETAHGCHMSAAKYLAIQELMEVDETATLEAYSNSSIRQIRQRTRECQGEHGNTDKTGQGGGPAHGGGQNSGGQGQGNSQSQGSGQGQGNSQSQGSSQGQGNQSQGNPQNQGEGQGQGSQSECSKNPEPPQNQNDGHGHGGHHGGN